MGELGRVGEADAAKRWRAWRSAARDVARQEVDARNHQRRCGHQQRENGSGAILTDDQAANEARQDEAARAPQPHPAIVEAGAAHAAHRHGLDQRHDGGPVEGEQQRGEQHLPEAARGPEQQERQKRSPGESDENGAARAGPIGGKADQRREQDAGEERRRQQQRDGVLVEAAPMQPHRHVGQVATDDEEQRGVEKAKTPGERGDLKARQTRHVGQPTPV